MTTLGDRLRELRKQRNTKQEDLANLLDVSTRAIQYYENDERTMDYKQLLLIATFWDVSLDYLVGRTDNPNSHKVPPDPAPSDDASKK